MSETTTTTMTKDGRVTIPQPTREALGVDGKEAIVRLDIEVREVKDDD